MTRDDVITLFKAWRGAGLRPPVDKNSVMETLRSNPFLCCPLRYLRGLLP